MTIFPTLLDPTDVYSSNYPGQVRIFMDEYFMGPNQNYNVV